MKRTISDKLARKILREKIRDLNRKIAEAPDFLAEELQAERQAYAAHLAWLKENERNDGEGRV